MEAKKTPEADLTKKSWLFMSIGLVVSMLLVTTAFEWKFYDDGSLVDLGMVDDDFDDIMEVPPTEQPPPPPPKIVQPEVVEVPDEEEIEQEIEVDLDIEITEETQIEELVYEDAPEEEVADEIFTVVEDQPEPEGGLQAFYQYIQKNLKYPSQARRMGVEGKVFVQFVVDTDGTLNDVQVVKGIGGGCDEEALRIVQAAKPWKPGKQRGRAVKVRMVIPITFKLG